MKRNRDAIGTKRIYARCSQGLHLAAKIAAASTKPIPMKLEDFAALAIREKLERAGVDIAAYERQFEESETLAK